MHPSTWSPKRGARTWHGKFAKVVDRGWANFLNPYRLLLGAGEVPLGPPLVQPKTEGQNPKTGQLSLVNRGPRYPLYLNFGAPNLSLVNFWGQNLSPHLPKKAPSKVYHLVYEVNKLPYVGNCP